MKRFFAAIGLVVLVLIPSSAYADIILTPFAGVTFGGDAPSTEFTIGGSVTFMGAIGGVEVEYGYTPDFFGEQSGTVLISSSNVQTLMGNVLIGVGKGPVRPYVVGGFGLVRSRVNASDVLSNISSSDWGLDGGAGIMFFLTDRIGFRGDVRYFRTLTDLESPTVGLGTFNFWRGVGGVSFKF